MGKPSPDDIITEFPFNPVGKSPMNYPLKTDRKYKNDPPWKHRQSVAYIEKSAMEPLSMTCQTTCNLTPSHGQNYAMYTKTNNRDALEKSVIFDALCSKCPDHQLKFRYDTLLASMHVFTIKVKLY